MSEWQWWRVAGDVCGNVMVTDEIWRGDYHCRGGLHIIQTKYLDLDNIYPAEKEDLFRMAESLNHKDCQPVPVDVKEVLEKGLRCRKIFPP